MNNKEQITPCQAQEILNAIHTITGDNQALRKVDGQVAFHNPHDEKIKENCPLSVPVQYVEEYHEPVHRERKDPAKTYEELYICAGAGKIPNEVLKYSAKKWVEKSPVICTVIDGEKRFFEGRAKSSARYNTYNYWRIHDHAKKLHSFGYKPYFLTVTNDPKPYRHDYVEAWEGFHSNVGRLLKNICRKWNAYYECVYEAQKSGNPHAHIVIWFSNFFDDDKIVKTKKKTFISAGTLKNYLRKYETGTGFMELRRGEDKDPINYLLKYISKATTRDFYSMAKDTNRLSDSDRKDLLSAMMPILAGVRQFSMSQGVLNEENQPSQATSSSQDETQTPQAFKDSGEAREYLKKLCINFPLSCQSLVRLFSFKQLSKGVTISPKDLQKLSQARKDELYSEGKCLGCKGCVITHFINYINTGSDPWFDIKPKEQVTPTSKVVTEDGLLAQLFVEMEGIKEDSQNNLNQEQVITPEEAYETLQNSLVPEPSDEQIEKETKKQQAERDKAIYGDICANQNIIGHSMLTNLEKFSANSEFSHRPAKITITDPRLICHKDLIALSDERFNALKGNKTIYVYAELKESQVIRLFDFEYTQKIILVRDEKTNETAFAEFKLMDKDNIHTDCHKTTAITVELKPTEETSHCNFDNTIRFYRNDDLTD